MGTEARTVLCALDLVSMLMRTLCLDVSSESALPRSSVPLTTTALVRRRPTNGLVLRESTQ